MCWHLPGRQSYRIAEFFTWENIAAPPPPPSPTFLVVTLSLPPPRPPAPKLGFVAISLSVRVAWAWGEGRWEFLTEYFKGLWFTDINTPAPLRNIKSTKDALVFTEYKRNFNEICIFLFDLTGGCDSSYENFSSNENFIVLDFIKLFQETWLSRIPNFTRTQNVSEKPHLKVVN